MDRKLALTFGVFHGRVIQIMKGKVPIVHGRGYSIEGWGGTRIQTEVIRDGEVWLKNHQTGGNPSGQLCDMAPYLVRESEDSRSQRETGCRAGSAALSRGESAH
jgi:hypothetical protein